MDYTIEELETLILITEDNISHEEANLEWYKRKLKTLKNEQRTD